MATTLRSRLWLSFTLLTLFSILAVGVGLILELLRNPPTYRQAVVKLRVEEATLVTDFNHNPSLLLPARLETTARQEAEVSGMRILLLSPQGNILADSHGANEAASGVSFPRPLKPNDSNLAQVNSIRDASRRVWWYTLRPVANGSLYLVVATPRTPLLTLATILVTLRDEVLVPMLEAGGIALLVALILAVTLSQWIASPLHHIAEMAGSIAAGSSQPVLLEGPKEVQDLAQAINEMSHKVQVSQQSQRDFVANVSHELKTPLTAIQGFAQALVDGAAQTPDALKQAGEVILAESSRMYRMVMDLLTLARLDAGTADLHFEPLNLESLLQQVVVKFSPQANQARVSLQSQLEPVPDVQADSDRLAQVFSNLVDNAIKYTPAGGTVLVKTQMAGDKVLVRVADSGMGIAADDLSRIFERFYRTDKSRQSGPNHGAGLGLAIARQIVQAHGGTITASSSLGRGSEFIVRLPVSHLAETIRTKSSRLTR